MARIALSRGGLLVHDRNDWPCAVCRPERIPEAGAGYCLCVDCAQSMLVAAGAGSKEARALLSELAEALALLEPPVQNLQQVLN